MNSITFTLPWIPILYGLGGISALVVVRSLVRSRQAAERQKLAAKAEAQGVELRAKKAKLDAQMALFSPRWRAAYERCKKHGSYEMSRQWIRKWLSEQDDLPALTCEAAQTFARELGQGPSSSQRWAEALDILVPHFETKGKDL